MPNWKRTSTIGCHWRRFSENSFNWKWGRFREGSSAKSRNSEPYLYNYHFPIHFPGVVKHQQISANFWNLKKAPTWDAIGGDTPRRYPRFTMVVLSNTCFFKEETYIKRTITHQFPSEFALFSKNTSEKKHHTLSTGSIVRKATVVEVVFPGKKVASDMETWRMIVYCTAIFSYGTDNKKTILLRWMLQYVYTQIYLYFFVFWYM